MTKMHLSKTLVYRVPQFSYLDRLGDCWEELKQSIGVSSTHFYALIKDLDHGDLGKQPEAIQHIIRKYFNRSRFRATPYGRFAAIGTVSINNTGTPVILSKEPITTAFRDWTDTNQILPDFRELVAQDAQLFANSSWYLTNSEIRYVGKSGTGYELSEVPQDPLMVALLKACRKPVRISELMASFVTRNGTKTLLSVLEQMMADHLLISEFHPNLIGTDYFERVPQVLPPGSSRYLITERPVISGAVPPGLFRHLPELIARLHGLLPSYQSQDLDEFRQKFRRKFGERQVPVMMALDPEMGLGYGQMDDAMLTGELIDQLARRKEEASKEPEYSTIQQLLPHLLDRANKVIDLEHLPIPPNLRNKPLPNTLSVLCSVADDLVQLEYTGGCTANALLGRFTLANDAILHECRSLAQTEQLANPEVCFFDIAYGMDGVVGNVHRRKSVYDLQLSLMDYDTSENPLTLDDLYLSVTGTKLILRSASLGKQMVPRFSTAYNYLLSDLPVFRLLCDLQHQDTHKNLDFRLRDRIKDLDFYPRLQFKNIILSPMTWRLQIAELQSAQGRSDSERLSAVIREKAMSAFVRTGGGDQTLCIDTASQEDLQLLLQLLRKHRSLYLEEVGVPRSGLLVDPENKPYLPQFMVSLYHREEIYKERQPAVPEDGQPLKGKFILPGNDWLYFELYCHPKRSDELLKGPVAELVRMHGHYLKKWFFIRYAKGGHHLRLRFQLHDPGEGQVIIPALSALLLPMVESGLVEDLLLRTYERETERYGVQHIAEAESHSYTDSDFALQIIAMDLTDSVKYELCLLLAAEVGKTGIIDKQVFSKLIHDASEGYLSEHSATTTEFKALNTAYRVFMKREPSVWSPMLKDGIHRCIASMVELMQTYLPGERPFIFTSLFHMHINRLFPVAQRTHEAVIYYFIAKEFKHGKHAVAAPAWFTFHRV
ncbi:thiopeptide-type bacteriocin biosynthesis protein [Pedobacter sp. KR3-3]|uniref:Thiopeptide-type bacteriocin biosynthesis protein n=1 Tax=Pedobacter albus TaxID=3113905 RepID=A0ABU7IAC1_9SPHI|nr:thiopeptide-type bacteriocin biosynthesis protein [Pedobacter sp. KR3-3]MEE1946423.1 thiopeptide-type bacteriocin biosynthesis protein [Pedobacter sp. KR3-3]